MVSPELPRTPQQIFTINWTTRYQTIRVMLQMREDVQYPPDNPLSSPCVMLIPLSNHSSYPYFAIDRSSRYKPIFQVLNCHQLSESSNNANIGFEINSNAFGYVFYQDSRKLPIFY
jgi:hypothetical protein